MIIYQTIDLGLPSGTLWCDRNIGASSPEDAGLYFAWGETKGYTVDQIRNGERYFNKYNYTYKDKSYTLPLDKDAANINIGKDWSMPTKEDFQELLEYTTNEWVKDYNGTGVSGRLFTSTVNGNSIFVPAAGCACGCYIINDEGNLWSNSIFEDDINLIHFLHLDSVHVSNGICYGSYFDFPIRGIRNPDFSHLFFNN